MTRPWPENQSLEQTEVALKSETGQQRPFDKACLHGARVVRPHQIKWQTKCLCNDIAGIGDGECQT